MEACCACACACNAEVSPRERRTRTASTMTDCLQDVPELAIPHAHPRMRTNPAELHWRTEGATWVGNMELAWRRKYPHLVDSIYCRNCGAVPCPLDHDEIKETRMMDLEFVRELVTEKKELEAEHAKLQDDMSKMSDDSTGWKKERAVLMEELNLAEKRQQEWDFERQLMEGEMNRMRLASDRQLNKLADFRKEQQKVGGMSKSLKALEEEKAQLTAEVSRVHKLLTSQTEETTSAKKDIKRLTSAIEAAENTARVLKVKLDNAYEERDETQRKLGAGEIRMSRVEDDIRELLKEFEVKTKTFAETENMGKFLIGALRNKMQGLRVRLEESEGYRINLEEEIGAYLTEIEKLRDKLSSDKRFRMFVDIKRQCNGLKEQNEALRHQKGYLGHAHSIPILNVNGHVASPPDRQGSSCLQVRRAKSASAFTSRERLYSHRKIRNALKLDNF